MRNLLLVIALILCQTTLLSQDRYFMFVQTENDQAFYARVQGRTLSSSANGYLIVPRITDTSISITFGFPKRLFPEQTFLIRNIRSDKGFLLKNSPEKGWMLSDMQTADIFLAISADKPEPTRMASRPPADPFSELLSTVIDDSSLRETPIVATPAPPAIRKPAVTKINTFDSSNKSTIQQPPPAVLSQDVKSDVSKPMNADVSPSRVATATKLMEQIDASGVQMVFTDQAAGGVTDTISIWIPKASGAKPDIPRSNVVKDPPASDPTPKSDQPALTDRTDCKSFISIKDLGLLRRRMETLNDEDSKVSLALRSFKESCFSTEQVRSLLVVFGREEGRFKLLDAAFPHVFDPARFAELESVLKDSYFIYRFRKKISSPPRG
jgi:hypothetical protein